MRVRNSIRPYPLQPFPKRSNRKTAHYQKRNRRCSSRPACRHHTQGHQGLSVRKAYQNWKTPNHGTDTLQTNCAHQAHQAKEENTRNKSTDLTTKAECQVVMSPELTTRAMQGTLPDSCIWIFHTSFTWLAKGSQQEADDEEEEARCSSA